MHLYGTQKQKYACAGVFISTYPPTFFNMEAAKIEQTVQKQRAYFLSEETLDINFRKAMLGKLLVAIEKREQALYEALWTDLHKSEEEAYLTEISIVKGEIRNHLKHIDKWTRAERHATPLTLFPASTRVVTEPLGNALIIAPWNYPVQLLLNPLVGAISSGCTAVLKPSPYVPNVSKVLRELIEETFEEKYIAIFEGHREVNEKLLEQRFDIIFFTGSPAFGRSVMAAASKHLSKLVLELGGKSPCIVDKDADIALAAKRIAWGKTLNSGQTCIAPDYLFLHKDIKEDFIKAFSAAVHALHGDDIKADRHYVRLVSGKAFERVLAYLQDGRIVCGGEYDKDSLYMEPTLLDEVSSDSAVMTEEIFGPVFPIMTFGSRDEVIKFIRNREKPLALYYFGKEKNGMEVIHRTSSGGACINDTIVHIANENVPFGGVGNSGMGAYHGIESIKAFSHRRTVISSAKWIDTPFRYMPYKFFSLVKKLLA